MRKKKDNGTKEKKTHGEKGARRADICREKALLAGQSLSGRRRELKGKRKKIEGYTKWHMRDKKTILEKDGTEKEGVILGGGHPWEELPLKKRMGRQRTSQNPGGKSSLGVGRIERSKNGMKCCGGKGGCLGQLINGKKRTEELNDITRIFRRSGRRGK